jgi:hypothetical protein
MDAGVPFIILLILSCGCLQGTQNVTNNDDKALAEIIRGDSSLSKKLVFDDMFRRAEGFKKEHGKDNLVGECSTTKINLQKQNENVKKAYRLCFGSDAERIIHQCSYRDKNTPAGIAFIVDAQTGEGCEYHVTKDWSDISGLVKYVVRNE